MTPDPTAELDKVLAQIDSEHAALKAEVARRMERLTQLHRRADELRIQARLTELPDPAPTRLRAVT